MNEDKRGVSIKEVEDAVQRAVESAEWAKQMDDARALACLRSFLTSSNAKSLLYVHLVALQPELFEQQEDNSMKQIPMTTVCNLFENAFCGRDTSDIIDVKYVGTSPLGSAKYSMTSCSGARFTLYVRNCRTGLRGELNEDDFLKRKEPYPEPAAAHKPRGLASFLKRLLSFP